MGCCRPLERPSSAKSTFETRFLLETSTDDKTHDSTMNGQQQQQRWTGPRAGHRCPVVPEAQASACAKTQFKATNFGAKGRCTMSHKRSSAAVLKEIGFFLR